MPLHYADYGYIDVVTNALRAHKKVKGCCSNLSPLLNVEFIREIMDIMRSSIGETISHSNREPSLNLTNFFESMGLLIPSKDLLIKLKDRYMQIICISNIFVFQN